MSSERRREKLGELAQRLRRLSDMNVLFSQALSDRLGLNLTDFKCSSILDQQGPMTAGRLAELTGLTSGAITGVVDRLERAGYVRRAKDPHDRRAVILESIDQDERFDALLAPMLDALGALARPYTDAQLDEVGVFVDRLADMMQGQTHVLRAAAREPQQGELSAPLGGLKAAKLRFHSGFSRMALSAEPMDALYRGRFEGTPPVIKVRGDTVTIQYAGFAFLPFKRTRGELRINAGIPWEVEAHGGVSDLDADLSAAQVTGVLLRGGVSDVSLGLPRPSGIVPVRISGGASAITLRRPAGVAARVQITGGLSHLAFDGQILGSVGGQTKLQSDGFDRAHDRYEIEVSGGASSVTVEAR